MGKKTEQAFVLLNSVRGKYIVGQALFIAANILDDPGKPPHEREPSNARDMRFLIENIPALGIYAALNSPEAKAEVRKAMDNLSRESRANRKGGE